MKQQTSTVQLTNTKTAIGLTVAMIAALGIGLSFLVFFGKTLTTKEPSVVRPAALAITDITSAQISVDLPNGLPPWNMVRFWGLTTTGPSNTLFGYYTNDPGGFNDGQSSRTPMPLMVEVDTQMHQAMIITMWVFGANQVGLNNKALPGIKTADAQVATDRRVICIPRKTTLGAARYYVDGNGNTYFDQAMTRRANREDCNRFVARTFAPNDINDISPGFQPDITDPLYINFAKSWETLLGTYDFSSDSFVDGEEDNINSEAPLFSAGGNPLDEELTIPAMSLLVRYDQDQYKTLCFPETILSPQGSESGSTFVYFYDVNGSPYSDAFLTHPVLSTSCNALLANSLTPIQVIAGQFNALYDGTPEIRFMRDNVQLAGYDHLDGSIDHYDLGEADENSDSPLYIRFTPLPEDVTYPARTAVMYTETNDSYTLCVPETVLTSYNNGGEYVYYFYDTTGTPYHDNILTDPVLDSSCNALLANSLTPIQVIAGQFNALYDGTPEIRFMRDNVQLAGYDHLDGSIDHYDLGEADENSDSPLYIRFTPTSQDETYPARTAVMYTETNDSYTLCVPETVLTSYNNGGEYVYYFYDTNGTPYSDNLLTQPVTSSACSQLLANALTPVQINSGQFNALYDGTPEIRFMRDNVQLAGYDYLHGSINHFDFAEADENSDSPLYIRFTPLSDDITYPENIATINIDNQVEYTLCVPETELISYNNGGEYVYYFYDTNGTPYSDNLLTQQVTCGCTDNDGNILPAPSGTCTDHTGTYTFHQCLTDYSISYTYCDNNGNCIDLGNMCASNFCDQAVCWETVSCADNDGGQNYYTASNIEVGYDENGNTNQKTISDVCHPTRPQTVIERYCESDIRPARGIGYDCPNVCDNGACVE